MTGKRQPVYWVRTLRSLGLYLLLLVMLVWPGSMLAPRNGGSQHLTAYDGEHLFMHDSWQTADGLWVELLPIRRYALGEWERELLNDPGWEHPYIAPHLAVP
jgi:hypothetical protein